MTPTEEQLRKLIELRNKKILAQEQYKVFMDEICSLVAPGINKENTDALQIELDEKEYEFIWSNYYQCVIFRPKMRKGGNCYGTADKNGTNIRRPVYGKK